MTASNAVVLAASKIGSDPDTITHEDLPSLARNISPILRVFLGPEAAAQLSAEISNMKETE